AGWRLRRRRGLPKSRNREPSSRRSRREGIDLPLVGPTGGVLHTRRFRPPTSFTPDSGATWPGGGCTGFALLPTAGGIEQAGEHGLAALQLRRDRLDRRTRPPQ